MDFYKVAIVSCDIRGHSATSARDQVHRVEKINRIVAATIGSCEPGAVVWSSGGDGGHVAFRRAAWQQPAVTLLVELISWAKAERVPLRITCHFGEVCDVLGADDRVQLVGSGINYAGWLLGQVVADDVVASEDFRREMESSATDPAVTFHSPLPFPGRDFPTLLLYLLSLDDTVPSWPVENLGDLARLKNPSAPANDYRKHWDALYFTKRIWQTHSSSKIATSELKRASLNLQYRDRSSNELKSNPLLNRFKDDELESMLKLGQLVERTEGEFICRFDEPGDSLFVILRGQVGVYNSEGKGYHGDAAPMYPYDVGEIVGDFAFALGRHRTADLVALTDVSLLSFNNLDVQSKLLGDDDVGKAAATQFYAYISERILEHVSDNVSYLAGPKGNPIGPLTVGPDSPDDPLQPLRRYCELVPLTTFRVSLDNIAPQDRPKGLCILVAGTLRTETNHELDGREFPIIWIDLHDLQVPPRTYTNLASPLASPKILRIDPKDVDELTGRQKDALFKVLSRVGRRSEDDYRYDVFLCHSSEDKPVVLEVLKRLEEARLECWYDDKDMWPGDTTLSTIEYGVKHSRRILIFASRSYSKSAWTALETAIFTHLQVKNPVDRAIQILVIDQDFDVDDLPGSIRIKQRVEYLGPASIDRLIEVLRS
ncbi:TIR domain-containing protein [Saccharothrix syringae]|uniref:TIR domain-containing protein n=1 Tax=Saccharothrix syringae TaxID=103733 RepID=A0A5Q0GX13_SACSY|nr:TIR domain-containing protein [Saccharothrix syringae]QFZ18433.1 TIR domain-containing protein [Saccharothrix syringae]